MPWWFYPLVIVSPQVSSIVVETQVTALAEHTARALNQTHEALGLLTEEVDQTRKVVFQNQMALDILTAAQGGTCTIDMLNAVCILQIIKKKASLAV